jgi:prolyl oligopeptidase
MYLLHKRGIELNGENPTVVLGYGGFNRALLPSMLTSRLLWVEQGGIYAIANLRGGSEYGEAWHEAGMLEKKQNVFDDFIAAGEWLIEQNYTRREKLAISGRSNGGLLVSACMNQRPDLFGAVICGVPVTDMLRYQHFTVGRFWVPEYGDAEANAEHFDFMYKYSPLHNVEPGTTYPPTLVFTAASDDRVVPAHSLKYLATLQTADSGENPIVLRYETHAGHGMGKPVSKVIEEQRDVHAFLVKVLNVAPNN